MKLFYVKWIDSHVGTRQAWFDKEGTEEYLREVSAEALTIETVGFLLHEDTLTLSLTMSHNKGEVGPYITIPKSTIVDRQEIT